MAEEALSGAPDLGSARRSSDVPKRRVVEKRRARGGEEAEPFATMDLGTAADWEFLGEGGANIVFGYRGQCPPLVSPRGLSRLPAATGPLCWSNIVSPNSAAHVVSCASLSEKNVP